MHETIENIIKKWLKKHKDDGQYVGDYDGEFDLENCCLDGDFDLNDLADEVLKVVVDILEEKKFVKSPEEHQRRRDHTMKSGYEQCLDDIINLLSEHLSPNKENE